MSDEKIENWCSLMLLYQNREIIHEMRPQTVIITEKPQKNELPRANVIPAKVLQPT